MLPLNYIEINQVLFQRDMPQFRDHNYLISVNRGCYCDKSVNKERRNEGTKDRNAGRGRGPGTETWERGTRNPMASSK